MNITSITKHLPSTQERDSVSIDSQNKNPSADAYLTAQSLVLPVLNPVIKNWDDMVRQVPRLAEMAATHKINARFPEDQARYQSHLKTPEAAAYQHRISDAINIEPTIIWNNKRILVTHNEFPYTSWMSQVKDVKHMVAWCKEPQLIKDIQNMVKDCVPVKKTVVFRPDVPLSVPIWHAHVFMLPENQMEREWINGVINP